MLAALAEIHELLRPPGNPKGCLEFKWTDGNLAEVRPARTAVPPYPLVAGQPVLIDFTHSLADLGRYAGSAESYSWVARGGNFLRTLKGRLFGTGGCSERNLRAFALEMKKAVAGRPLVLMVGAATRGLGTEPLYADEDVRQIAFDVYPSAHTQFVADAHQIPLADASVDGVCVQAVMEHVLSPNQVADEIARVLKPGGILYAETPFLQHVHEGAYDFTRFTELGHRWLWRGFEEVRRGSLGGPGLSLYWAARGFLWALLRHRGAANLLAAPLLPLALVDRMIPEARRIDSANGAYFMGRKAEQPLSHHAIPPLYTGMQL